MVILGPSQTARSTTSPQNASSLPDHLDMSDADLIIQSSDLVDFRIHKLVLSSASPFFSDMFSLPQPPNGDTIDGLPVVHLSEDAEVLHSLLTMLYPIPSVVLNSYDKAVALLAASHKYDMVGVQSRIRTEIQSGKSPTTTGPVAFRAYAIASASGGGLKLEMESSARLTLDFPLTFEYICNELHLFEGRALCELISFRKRCRESLVSCFQSFLDFGNPPFNIWMSCTDQSLHLCSVTGHSPPWLTNFFQQYLTELGQAFTKPLPNPLNIREQYLIALQGHITSYSRLSCIACTKVHTMEGEKFSKELENRLAQAISEVGNSFIYRRNSESAVQTFTQDVGARVLALLHSLRAFKWHLISSTINFH
jgi:hypothetical protein